MRLHPAPQAIGIIDSRLPTVGVFSADAVASANKAIEVSAPEPAAAEATGAAARPAREAEGAEARRYERGVVFYMRERRVVGVLLWNLFNRMHVARQVSAHRLRRFDGRPAIYTISYTEGVCVRRCWRRASSRTCSRWPSCSRYTRTSSAEEVTGPAFTLIMLYITSKITKLIKLNKQTRYYIRCFIIVPRA